MSSILALLFHLTARIFVFIALGMFLEKLCGKRGEPVARHFMNFALFVLVPLFVTLTLWTSTRSLAGSWQIAVAAFLVLMAGALFAWVWARGSEDGFRRVCLPIIFMNSAYLAIPVCGLFWGQEGIAYVIIYNAVVTLVHFTAGVWWVSGRRSLGSVLELPVVYATMAGIALNLLKIHPPASIVRVNDIVSGVTLPAMLLFMGYRLGGIRFPGLKRAATGVALRMGGGWLAALAAVKVLSLNGTAAAVCIVVSAMPAAMYSYILSEHFGADSEFAAAAIFLGTVLTLAVLPLLRWSLAS